MSDTTPSWRSSSTSRAASSEQFRRRHSVDIAAQCISRLDFEDCVIYMLDDTESHWIQKVAYGPKNINYRDIHKPVTLHFEGIVGAVGP